jgi:hypothetical protein
LPVVITGLNYCSQSGNIKYKVECIPGETWDCTTYTYL